MGSPCTRSVVGCVPTSVPPDKCRLLHFAGFSTRPSCPASVSPTVLLHCCRASGEVICLCQYVCTTAPLHSPDHRVYDKVKQEAAQWTALRYPECNLDGLGRALAAITTVVLSMYRSLITAANASPAPAPCTASMRAFCGTSLSHQLYNANIDLIQS